APSGLVLDGLADTPQDVSECLFHPVVDGDAKGLQLRESGDLVGGADDQFLWVDVSALDAGDQFAQRQSAILFLLEAEHQARSGVWGPAEDHRIRGEVEEKASVIPSGPAQVLNCEEGFLSPPSFVLQQRVRR